MSIILESIAIPLFEDTDGGLRIGDSKVQLDRLISAREQGATAEDIVDMYPTLNLANVYAVVIWMLRHSDQVASYRNSRASRAAELKQHLIASGVERELKHENLRTLKANVDVQVSGG